jgi:WS/DGAT/MGAT family acyltransferase
VTDALIMQLDEIKAIRRSVEGATVNDVIVAIVGGGLRKYLQRKDELPATTLSCTAPINMRSERNSASSGNQVSNMTISMATDIAEPLQRLREVNRSATESKAFAEALGTSVIMDVSEIMAPQALGWGMRAASLAAANSTIPMPFNAVISNIPGPQVTLYLAGARLDLMMGMGPLLHTMGLFHAVFSGAGRITINFLSCREMLPDPAFYQQCLREAFEELREAAAKQARRESKQPAKPKARQSAKAKAKPVAKSKARPKAMPATKPKAKRKAKRGPPRKSGR